MLSNVFWEGPGSKNKNIEKAYETTIIEVILNVFNFNVLLMGVNSDIKTNYNNLKNYKVGLFAYFNGDLKSLCCYRTKVNSKLKHINSFDEKNLVLIEVYEYSNGFYELRRLDIKSYMKHQSIESDEDLDPALLFVCEE